jgi:hypothetical protein
MPTLWVLGGSFAVVHHSGDCYTHMVAAGLGLEVAGYALGGSSIPYMCIEQWSRIRDLISNGDIVLVALTSPSRTYFLETHPTISAVSEINNNAAVRLFDQKLNDISKEEKAAIIDYYLHLHRDQLNLSWLQSWCYELNHVCIERSAVAVVLDGVHYDDVIEPNESKSVVQSIGRALSSTFGGNTTAIDDKKCGNTQDVDTGSCSSIIRGYGHLRRISRAETVDTATLNWLEDHGDFRMNHMGLANHKVLADKIIHSVKSGAQLDLNTGFYTRYIDQKYFKSVDWLQQHTTWPPICPIEGVWP